MLRILLRASVWYVSKLKFLRQRLPFCTCDQLVADCICNLKLLPVMKYLVQDILKNVRAILNKLTPQKFTPLMQKFRLLPINTENRLREVINLVFEKVISLCDYLL